MCPCVQAEERRSEELQNLHSNIVECTSGQQLLGFVQAVDQDKPMLLHQAGEDPTDCSQHGGAAKAHNVIDLELVWQGACAIAIAYLG